MEKTDDIALRIKEHVEKSYHRKEIIDKIIKDVFLGLAILAVAIVFVTVIYLIYSGIKPFVHTYTVTVDGVDYTGHLNLWEFITGTRWTSGEFTYGIGWVIINTVYLTLLSLILSAPLGIFTALFITRIAPKGIGEAINTVVTILAGIPSVIIGVFGMGIILPMVKNIASAFGQSTFGGRSILAAILVLAMMSLPTIASMSVTAIRAVDKKMPMASLALGASKTQTNFKVILTSAQSGIFASIILGMGRAIGEATAIQMVTGATTGPTFGIFDNTATITTVMLTGMGEASVGSLNYDARFAAGLFLMAIILITNLGLNAIRQAIYRKQNGIYKKPGLIKTGFTYLKNKIKPKEANSHE